MAALGAKPGQLITIESRRGRLACMRALTKSSPMAPCSCVCFYEAAIKQAPNSALDPFGKIPEFKYCAVPDARRYGAGPDQFRGGQILEPA